MSWKTTVFGLLGMVAGLLPQFWPQYAKLGGFLSAVSLGALGMFARDNNKTSEQVGAGGPQPDLSGFRVPVKILFLLAVPLALVGCVNKAILQGDIVSIKSRTFGLVVAQSPSTQSPEIKLGFDSTVVQFIPSSTNALFAPPYADTFDLKQGLNPFGTGISENTGAGTVRTGTNGETSIEFSPIPAAAK